MISLPDTIAPSVRRGFSMIEMLMVVTVAGLGLAAALPRVQRSAALGRVSSAQSTVTGDLRQAAGLASMQRRPMVVAWQASTGELLIRDVGTNTVRVRRSLGSSSEYGLQVSLVPDSAIILPSSLTRGLCLRLQAGNAPDTLVRRVMLTVGGQARSIAPGAACA